MNVKILYRIYQFSAKGNWYWRRRVHCNMKGAKDAHPVHKMLAVCRYIGTVFNKQQGVMSDLLSRALFCLMRRVA
jgi:hypothetical protein